MWPSSSSVKISERNNHFSFPLCLAILHKTVSLVFSLDPETVSALRDCFNSAFEMALFGNGWFLLESSRQNVGEQSDQIWRFLEFQVTNFLTKIFQMLGYFLGCFKNTTFKVKNVPSFWSLLGKNWATFCSNIWSH